MRNSHAEKDDCPPHWARKRRLGSRDSVTDVTEAAGKAPDGWLTDRRLWRLGTLLLAAQALAALALVLSASGGLDALGRPLGNDFLAFWSAARLALMGEPAAAWDIARLFQAGREALPENQLVYSFSYPPVFQMMLLPLGRLDWATALALWSGTGLALYALGVRLATRLHPKPALALVLGLAFPAAFVNLLQGQTGIVSLLLLGGGLLLVERRPTTAGVLIGLACFKPHLGLLVPLALLAGRQWRAFASAAGTVLALIGLSLIVLGPAPWGAFLSNLTAAGDLVSSGTVPWPKMPSVLAALRLAGAPEEVAWAAQAVAAAVATAVVVWLWATRPGRPMVVAATVCAALLVPPHLNDHDLVLLAVPLWLLVRAGQQDGWRRGEPTALALAWLAPMVLAPVAELTAVQLGPVVVAGLLVLTARRAIRCADRGQPAPPGPAMSPGSPPPG